MKTVQHTEVKAESCKGTMQAACLPVILQQQSHFESFQLPVS